LFDDAKAKRFSELKKLKKHYVLKTGIGTAHFGQHLSLKRSMVIT
jgi:hypothetical protein